MRSGEMTVRPSGFFQPEAILARNLLGATPADAVSRGLLANPRLQAAGDVDAERLAPGVLGDVEVSLVHGERLDQRCHAAKNGEDLLRDRRVLRRSRGAG